jgi:hypothetical protein
MATQWRIESQIEDIQPAGAAGFTRGFKVGWITDSGIRGTVFVPETQYTPENVTALVSAAVANAALVAGLSGTV